MSGRECSRPGCSGEFYARDMCRHHHSKYWAAGRTSRMVSSDPARAHIEVLAAAGATRLQIADAAGVALRTVQDIVSGKRPRVYSSTVNKIVAAAYTPPPLRPGQCVDATGTMRRLRALGALGWSTDALAAQPEIECTAMGLSTVRSGSHPMCTERIAQSVAAVFSRLWDQPRPEGTQVLNRARRERWALPLEWDDIDDPSAEPVRSRRTDLGMRGQAADRVEAVELWMDDPRPEWAKGSASQLAERLGTTVRTVERDKALVRSRREQEDVA